MDFEIEPRRRTTKIGPLRIVRYGPLRVTKVSFELGHWYSAVLYKRSRS